jgi:hypothetical protein
MNLTLLWLSLLAFFVVDSYIEHLREFKAAIQDKPGVNHNISSLFRVIYFFDLIWRFHITNGWQLLFFALGGFFSGWFLLNIFINVMGKENWWVLSPTAWLDKLENKAQVPIVISKVILAALFIILSYNI